MGKAIQVMNKDRVVIAAALALIGVGAVGPEVPSVAKPHGLSAPEKVKGPRGGGPKNHNADGPACPGGPVYRKVLDPETNTMGWRAYALSLYYREPDGQIHAYQPGQDEAKDKAFPGISAKKRLVLMTRADRRALHKEERARYKAIVKARGIQT